MSGIQRQIVNILIDTTGAVMTPNGNDVNIPFNLRFRPDSVIVRQLAYNAAATATNARVLQLYTTMTDDNILCVFPDSTCVCQLNIEFPLYRKFQNGTYNFQLQYYPNQNNSGGGSIYSTGLGTVQFMLEFVQYADKV